jgi:hypothetical protein
MMQDRKAPDSGYLAPLHHSRISNLNRAKGDDVPFTVEDGLMDGRGHYGGVQSSGDGASGFGIHAVTPADTEPAQGLGQFEKPPGHLAGVESPRDLQEEPQSPMPQNISVAGPVHGHDERAKQPHRAVIGPSLAYPSGRNGAFWIVETILSPYSVHAQSTLSPMWFHMGNYVMWKHVELCYRHIETRGPKVIRIK